MDSEISQFKVVPIGPIAIPTKTQTATTKKNKKPTKKMIPKKNNPKMKIKLKIPIIIMEVVLRPFWVDKQDLLLRLRRILVFGVKTVTLWLQYRI